MPVKLSDYEIKLLKMLRGDQVTGLGWGAAMGAAIEFLREDGFVKGFSKIEITQKGKDYLNYLEVENVS